MKIKKNRNFRFTVFSAKSGAIRKIRLLWLGFEKRSLTFKLVLVVSLGFILLVSSATLLFERLSNKAIAEIAVTRALYQALQIKSELTDIILDSPNQEGRMLAFLDHIESETGIDQVSVFDSEGIIRFSSRANLVGAQVNLAAEPGGFRLHDKGYTEILKDEDHGKLRMVYPMSIAPKETGGIELFLPLKGLYRQFFFSRLWIIGGGFLLMIIGAFLIRFLINGIVKRPIKKMTRVISQAQQGRMDVRMKVYEDPQLRRLSLQFNALIIAIEKARIDLEEQYQKELGQANRLASMGQYISNISHEIKNPLAAICSALHVIQSEMKTREDEEIFNEMQLKLDHIERTVSNLLRYARQAPPHSEACSLRKIIEASLQNSENHMRRCGISLNAEFPDEELTVFADEGQLQQVFLNILLNAIFMMEQEGGQLRVKVEKTTDRGREEAAVRIEDSGPGISPEQTEKIFEPFFTTRRNGTGLGLSVARGIVELHGGSISAASAPGRGACFSIFLPVHSNGPSMTERVSVMEGFF